MKKIGVLILFCLFGVFVSPAQNSFPNEIKASVSPVGSYVIIKIENLSELSLISLDIKVTAENLRIYSDGEEEWIPVTFYNGRKYFDPPVLGKSSCEFKSNSITKDMNYTSRLRNINISICNAVF